MITDQVPAALAGERIDRVVALMTDLSRSAVKALVAAGSVTVNGVTATSASQRVDEGDVVTAATDDAAGEPEAAVASPAVEIDVVFADDHVVVVNKPVGLVVHPGAGHVDDTLVNGLLHRFPGAESVGEPDRPGVVHRLDRDTSGLLVWARTSDAHDELSAQLAERSMGRTYLTIVGGIPDSEHGMIDAPIGRSKRTRTRMTVAQDGREARTRFERLEVFHDPIDASLLRCTLETGRTHQIRVHLGAIGLPVLGDRTYGRPDPFGIGRPLLHAWRLTFTHPATDERLTFTAPIPPDFRAVLDGFGAVVDLDADDEEP